METYSNFWDDSTVATSELQFVRAGWKCMVLLLKQVANGGSLNPNK
jgi:hypothetical protein